MLLTINRLVAPPIGVRMGRGVRVKVWAPSTMYIAKKNQYKSAINMVSPNAHDYFIPQARSVVRTEGKKIVVGNRVRTCASEEM